MSIEFTGNTGAKSTFKFEPPTFLRLKLMLNGELVKHTECSVLFDGAEMLPQELKTSTDKHALLEVPIPPSAERAHIEVYTTPKLKHKLYLGRLASADTESGQQARLRQLGYYCGDEENEQKTALNIFQMKHDVPYSDTLDAPTKHALIKAYRC